MRDREQDSVHNAARKVVDMWRRDDPRETEDPNWSEFDHLLLALDAALAAEPETEALVGFVLPAERVPTPHDELKCEQCVPTEKLLAELEARGER